MSRLLFAAARGARIEYGTYCHSSADGYEWVEGEDLARMRKLPELYRIHPDDAHLAYGPISTALREYADTGKTQYTLTAMLAMVAYNHEKEYPFILASEWGHASMFALILAEGLADEGL